MVVFADQGVASLTNFLTVVIVGRICTKEELGLYTLGFSILLFVTNIQKSLILTPYTVLSPRFENNEFSELNGSTAFYQFVFSLLCFMLVYFVGTKIPWGSSFTGLQVVVFILAIVTPFASLREYVRQVSLANLRPFNALTLDLFVGLVQIGGLLLFVFNGVLSVKIPFILLGIACTLGAGINIVLMLKGITFKPARVVSDLKKSWSLGKWLLANTLARYAGLQTYPWLLASFHGTGQTGVLAACMGVICLINPFTMGMNNFLSPQIAHAFAREGVIGVRRIVTKATLIFLTVMIPFCFGLFIFGDLLLRIIYGAKYFGNGNIIGILALSQLASALTFPINNGLLAMDRADVAFKSYTLTLFVTFTFGLFLVKYFGPIGVAYGILIGNTVASMFRWFAYHSITKNITIKEGYV